MCVWERENKTRREKKVPYMATMLPSNRFCLQPNFPWHTLNSECNTASLHVCASLWVGMFEQVSAHFTELTKCNWFGWEQDSVAMAYSKPVTTNTHPPSVNYCMTDSTAFTQLWEDKMCPLKHSPYQKPWANVILFVTTAQVQLLWLLISWLTV